MILILNNLQYCILPASLLTLFPTLLTSDIRKSKNDLLANDKLKIIDRFSSLLLPLIYSAIAIISFFYTRLALVAIVEFVSFRPPC